MEDGKQDWMKKEQTDTQRKMFFSLLSDLQLDKDVVEGTIERGIGELNRGETSQLIDILKNDKADKIGQMRVWLFSQEDERGENTEKKPETERKESMSTFAGSREEAIARKDKNEIVATEESKQSEPAENIGLVQIGDMEISETSINNLRKIPTMLNSIFKNIMQKGTDYDTIPGTQKPTLLKPGSELLRMAFNLNFKTEIDTILEDWDKGRFYYQAKTHFYNKNGGYVGTGIGSANSEETRYSSRWVFESDIPEGVDRASLKSKTRISKNNKEYKVYLVEPGLAEKATQINTLQKMAKKRSFVDGILSITGASRIFTQDIEDMQGAQ